MACYCSNGKIIIAYIECRGIRLSYRRYKSVFIENKPANVVSQA